MQEAKSGAEFGRVIGVTGRKVVGTEEEEVVLGGGRGGGGGGGGGAAWGAIEEGRRRKGRGQKRGEARRAVREKEGVVENGGEGEERRGYVLAYTHLFARSHFHY